MINDGKRVGRLNVIYRTSYTVGLLFVCACIAVVWSCYLFIHRRYLLQSQLLPMDDFHIPQCKFCVFFIFICTAKQRRWHQNTSFESTSFEEVLATKIDQTVRSVQERNVLNSNGCIKIDTGVDNFMHI